MVIPPDELVTVDANALMHNDCKPDSSSLARPMAHYRPHLKTAKDARAVRTRTALREAMLQLLGHKPLDKITILDLCETAGIGYTTFFRHHPTKEALLDDVAAEQIAALIELTVPIAEVEDIHASAIALFTYVNEHRELWSALLTGGAEAAMRNEFLRLSRQIAATRTRRNAWPPSDISTILVVSSTVELVSWWLQQKKPPDIEEAAAIYEHIIIQPHVRSDRIPPGRPAQRARSR
jgi:AcrR family transcriptional regulator